MAIDYVTNWLLFNPWVNYDILIADAYLDYDWLLRLLNALKMTGHNINIRK